MKDFTIFRLKNQKRKTIFSHYYNKLVDLHSVIPWPKTGAFMFFPLVTAFLVNKTAIIPPHDFLNISLPCYAILHPLKIFFGFFIP
jgi:hypothetical protein